MTSRYRGAPYFRRYDLELVWPTCMYFHDLLYFHRPLSPLPSSSVQFHLILPASIYVHRLLSASTCFHMISLTLIDFPLPSCTSTYVFVNFDFLPSTSTEFRVLPRTSIYSHMLPPTAIYFHRFPRTSIHFNLFTFPPFPTIFHLLPLSIGSKYSACFLLLPSTSSV